LKFACIAIAHFPLQPISFLNMYAKRFADSYYNGRIFLHFRNCRHPLSLNNFFLLNR
jgi:hypothetical protein